MHKLSECIKYMEDQPSVCDGFVPDPCFSYTNCTGSDYVSNWTEFCCQPQAVKNTRIWMLFVIGVVGMVGTVCNIITISTFTYLYCFANRIKRQFNQEFTMTSDPVFFLILHLSLCDLLYCVIGLPSYWSVYFYGYYRYSEMMCKYFGFFRKCLGISYKINKVQFCQAQLKQASLF